MKFQGKLKVLGDKSISHRSIILGSLSKGALRVKNFLFSDDTKRTLNLFRNLGTEIKIESSGDVIIKGRGTAPNNFNLKKEKIYCGNSGTTTRLCIGVLAGLNKECTLTGDASLSKRPMRRVIEPLKMMGAKITGDYLPVKIHKSKLKGIEYTLPVASAQVKSAIILAGLNAAGKTSIIEPVKSRDHTERMIKFLEGKIEIENTKISITNKIELKSDKVLFVPNDISSAAFFIIGALLKPGSDLLLEDITLNPLRTGLLKVLKNMGGNIEILNRRNLNNEPVGDLSVKFSKLNGVKIIGKIIPTLIDEIPIISVAALFAKGKTIIKDASELRVKETDRIKAIVSELSKISDNVKELPDGIEITGGNLKLRSRDFDSYSDHRIAMSLEILKRIVEEDFIIKNNECVKISYPEFFNDLNKTFG